MTARQTRPRIAIIGSGFSALCLGIHLKRAGLDTFTLFEKAERLGGTWRENTYPGAACDSPSFAYCFSFEQKTDWSRKWAGQEEILDYLEHCAGKYGLLPHIRFGTEIASARFDDEACLWRLRTTEGEKIEAEILVSGTGQLNRPWVPPIPGLEDFAGPRFHSARWRHDVPLAGRRVAVVGNAASAIQFIPQIAPEVEHLYVLQRSPNWMLPKGDREYTPAEHERFRKHPWLARLYRWWIWLSFELRWPAFKGNRWLSRRVEGMALDAMQAQVKDPQLRKKLVPTYPIGGKRILISDDYYPALQRNDVELVTEGIERVLPDGILTRTGRRLAADVLILATGFESTAFLAPMEIQGLGGRLLHQEWKDGAEAYLGIHVSGFPNFFMMYGPNTNLGHNSIIFMIECQTRYIMDCIQRMQAQGIRAIDLRREIQQAYNAQLRRELARTVWAATDRSWYKTADGRITNNWSGSTLRYWWRTRRADLRRYRQLVPEAMASGSTGRAGPDPAGSPRTGSGPSAASS